MFGGIDSEKLNEESKFIPKSPYAAQKYSLIKSQRFIENPTIFLLLMEFFLIMNHRLEEKLLLQEKLQEL